MHTSPHIPQFEVLLAKSTQEPEQLVVVPPQLLVHAEPLHTSPAPQTFGHEPQWASSDDRSTQLPPQFV